MKKIILSLVLVLLTINLTSCSTETNDTNTLEPKMVRIEMTGSNNTSTNNEIFNFVYSRNDMVFGHINTNLEKTFNMVIESDEFFRFTFFNLESTSSNPVNIKIFVYKKVKNKYVWVKMFDETNENVIDKTLTYFDL